MRRGRHPSTAAAARARSRAGPRAGVAIAAAATVALALTPAPVAAAPPPPPAPGPPSTTTAPTATTGSSPTTTAPPPPPIDPAAWGRFDQLVSDALVGRGDQAAGVAVSYNGRLLHAAAFGMRSPNDPTDPVDITDRFRIASASKVVTATVVLQLVAAGRLGLDDTVAPMLATALGVPLGDPRWSTVTVRQLLSHTGGVPKYRGQFFDGTFTSCVGAAQYGLARGLVRPPGTAHVYSNLDFCLLGLLIQHLTGQPYEQAVADMLLTPLGITGMRTAPTNDADPGDVFHATGPDRTFMEALGGAGSWVATPSDMVRILDSLEPDGPGFHPLPPELASLMRQPIVGVDYPEPSVRTYGLGIIVWPDGSWGHTGTVENTHTMLARRPDGLTWCILVSGDRPEQTEALRDVFDRAFAGAGISLP